VAKGELITDVLARYDVALALLKAHGVKTPNTRLDRYRRILESLADVDTKALIRQGRFRQLAHTLYEVSDILDIASLDARLYQDNAEALKKLRSISSGRDFEQDYKPGEHDAARDSAFEFSAAAHVASFGALAGFSRTNGDILLRDGECTRPVECKRLTSLQGLNGQLDKAVRQIRTQYSGHGMPAGFILMDVTSAVRALDRLTHTESEEEHLRAVDKLLTETVLKSRPVFQKGNRRPAEVLGLSVRLSVVGPSGTLGNVRRATSWQFIDFQEKNSPESMVFRSVAASLSVGGLIDHHDWEPSSLREAIDSIHPPRASPLNDDLLRAGYGHLLVARDND
jgi:hypothetical protein